MGKPCWPMQSVRLLFLGTLLHLLLRSVPSGYAQTLKINEVTIIHITQLTPGPDLPITAVVYHVFPAFDASQVHDSLFSSRREIWLRCPVRVTQHGYLFVQDDKLKVVLVPADTIHLTIGPSTTSTSRFHYSFSGNTQLEQAYYLAKKIAFSVEPAELGMNAGIKAPNLIEFKHHLDSLTQAELRFWHHYKANQSVSTWFDRFESDAIHYSDAMIRLYMSWYQTDFQRKTQRIPATYYGFLKDIPVRNAGAQYKYEYLGFLREYMNWRLKGAGMPIQTTAPETYYPALRRLSTQLLGDDLGSFFWLWSVSAGAQDNPERARTDLATVKPLKRYQYLVTYLKDRSQRKQRILIAGDKAPTFYLTDTNDSLVTLSQFKGQAVYLCFWFAACGGCKKEYPYENQLVEQFKNKPVKIISICTHTESAQWRDKIKKIGLKTVNLYANETWQKKLETAYAISTYPHYVLIDAAGRVVENFATRPSQNAAAKIDQALPAIGPK